VSEAKASRSIAATSGVAAIVCVALLARTGSELLAFLGVSVAAGIAEEFFYRG